MHGQSTSNGIPASRISALTLLLSIAVSMVCCHATRDRGEVSGATPSVELKQATAQKWTAGLPNGGSGTEFAFTMHIHADDVHFDHVRIGEQNFSSVVIRPGQGVSNTPVIPIQGEELLLRVSIRNDEAASNATSAVIVYRSHGATHELIADPIDLLQPQLRP